MAIKQDNNQAPRGATSSDDSDRVNQQADNGQGTTPSTGNNSGNSTADSNTSATPAKPSTATPPVNGQQQPYSGFTGNNYAALEDFIKEQMADVKVETPEERKKRERREKIEGAINGIADMGMALGNLYFTSQYAPNAYNSQNSLSEKYQQRLDKAKAEREKNRDAYINYAMTLGKLKDADRDFNFRVEQARNQQNNWKMQFVAGREDRANDVKFRDQAYTDSRTDRAEDVKFRDQAYTDSRTDRAEDVKWRQDRAKVEDEHWDKNFTEGVRQFNVSSSLQWKSLSLQAQRLQMERDNNSEFYTLGEGQGSVKVPKSAINSLNFAAVHRSLPESYRAKGEPKMESVAGIMMPVIDPVTKKQVYDPPTAEAMAIAVGAFLGDQSVPANQKTATRTALSQLGRKRGGNNRTMPGL